MAFTDETARIEEELTHRAIERGKKEHEAYLATHPPVEPNMDAASVPVKNEGFFSRLFRKK